MTRTEKADHLLALATREHIVAYRAAALIADPEERQEAYRKASAVYELQREYQRKVRHGEVTP